MIKRPRVVILGAGYGGLCVAHRLQDLTKPMQVEIILVDRNSYHVNTISLHEVAMGNANAQDISYDLVPIVRKPHARVMKAEVLSIDRENQQVITSEGELDYDYLVIALGYVPETFGIPGMLENAFQIDSIEQSEAISRHLEDQFRRYAFTDPVERDPKDISIIVGGSGFTGVELLGEITDRIPPLCKKYGLKKEYIKTLCISSSSNFLPMFSADEAEEVKSYLESKGVQFILNARINEATADSFVYQTADGKEEEAFAHTLIWTGGVSGSPLMAQCFGSTVKRGRLLVNTDLTAPGYDNLYVIGDCAAFVPEGCKYPEPPTAQIATQMGYHVAENISRQLKNRPRKAFHYIYRGTACSLGATHGVASLNGRTVTGFWAMRLKRFIESVTDYKISGIYNAIKNTRIFKLFNF